MPNGYPQASAPTQGGLLRAQQLVQQQYGQAATASLNAMQRNGLALPGQQQQVRSQGLQLPGQAQQAQQQYAMQQQQHAMQQRQQQLQQQPRLKVENDSPNQIQGAFQPQPNYGQTDGADEALEQWQVMLAQRRAITAENRQHADSMMRDLIMQQSADLQSGLMMPLNELPRGSRQIRRAPTNSSTGSTIPNNSSIPQLDGEVGNPDEDDEGGDNILCTYDKVQRVKNKWKCVLKDGIMRVNGKEWVFHKGSGEFEW